ncbi:hypothetical protein J2Z83_000376 [Virgibacillus natechei]|uniref:DUF1657 domain-containing protein n=1 Tax=Virgibacillus natechei TaxID=1216297 RepID=A0ABS4IBH9_9BACI|nr:DUF1657 domain-containing protein [Virgibacillus natechei]MBP1968284.1 hypothetical protein [Virgibacillus natechei]UZD14450.1 DUF1657 domain-containing protein [Virgibacillus natechei]
MTVGSQVKSCYASIKNVEATLNLLTNKAQDYQAKDSFDKAQQIITEVKDDMEKQVIQLTKEEPQYK